MSVNVGVGYEPGPCLADVGDADEPADPGVLGVGTPSPLAGDPWAWAAWASCMSEALEESV